MGDHPVCLSTMEATMEIVILVVVLAAAWKDMTSLSPMFTFDPDMEATFSVTWTHLDAASCGGCGLVRHHLPVVHPRGAVTDAVFSWGFGFRRAVDTGDLVVLTLQIVRVTQLPSDHICLDLVCFRLLGRYLKLVNTVPGRCCSHRFVPFRASRRGLLHGGLAYV